MTPTALPAASRPRTDLIWLAGMLALTAFLRLYQLDARPFQHDEAIHAWLSLFLSHGDTYRFDPVYHGPFLYWTTAWVYAAFGISDYTARLLPALFSIALVGLVWALRARLGTLGWKLAAAFLALSPTFTYYGRFLAHDNFCAVFTLLLIVLALAYRERPSALRMMAMGAVTGLFLATKAVVFIHLGLFALYALLIVAWDTFAPRWPRVWLLSEARAMLRHGRLHLLLGVLVMLVVYGLFYTSFLTHARGAWDGVFATLTYWGGQQAHPRIPGPVWFYLPGLMLHEPVFWLALPAVVWAARRRERPFVVFLAYWTIAAFTVYAIAQEKVPWLMMYILLPMVLLVGCWLDALLRAPWLRSKAMVLALMLAWGWRDTVWLTFVMPASTPHLLTYMAVSEDVTTVVEEIRREHAAPGHTFVVGSPTWPLSWYLRDLPVAYGLYPGWQGSASMVVAGSDPLPEVEAAGFTQRAGTLMTWWYPDLARLLGEELVEYGWHHRTQLPQGVYQIRVYNRPSLSR